MDVYDIYETIVTGRESALEILEGVEWTLGREYAVRYNYNSEVHVLVGMGLSDNEYIIISDSLALSQMSTDNTSDSLYTSQVNMNGTSYNVLNGHSDEEIADPFLIQELHADSNSGL